MLLEGYLGRGLQPEEVLLCLVRLVFRVRRQRKVWLLPRKPHKWVTLRRYVASCVSASIARTGFGARTCVLVRDPRKNARASFLGHGHLRPCAMSRSRFLSQRPRPWSGSVLTNGPPPQNVHAGYMISENGPPTFSSTPCGLLKLKRGSGGAPLSTSICGLSLMLTMNSLWFTVQVGSESKLLSAFRAFSFGRVRYCRARGFALPPGHFREVVFVQNLQQCALDALTARMKRHASGHRRASF